jgi:hypothetical protein
MRMEKGERCGSGVSVRKSTPTQLPIPSSPPTCRLMAATSLRPTGEANTIITSGRGGGASPRAFHSSRMWDGHESQAPGASRKPGVVCSSRGSWGWLMGGNMNIRECEMVQ